jgi:probable rRNA maturation factor
VDHTTDVLSFPLYENWSSFPKTGEFLLGDVVLDAGRVAAQAKKYGFTIHQETQRLLVHGIVHLLGYNHERNAFQKRKMSEIEDSLLKKLPGSYLKVDAVQ